MEYRLLGSIEVRSDGEIVALGPPKQRATLAILLMRAGEIVPADQIVDLLWGDHPPRTASHSVQIYISELRRSLEHDDSEPLIVTRPPGYVLRAAPETIDARRFERLVELGTEDLHAGNHSTATARLHEALGLWRGPPLSDFAYEEFAQDEIRHLGELHVHALEALAEAELALGREHSALAAIGAAIELDPLRERCRELQLLTLYRAGRQAEALRAYEAFRALIADELGVAPSPSLVRLQERLLIHDPSLGTAAGFASGIPSLPRNPYKGLRPFAEEDAADFFGREQLVAELVAALARGARLVALVGPSGSGKSSVIQAGLLPALRTGALPGAEAWVIVRMVPGGKPFEALATAMAAATGETSERLAELLRANDAASVRAVQQALPGHREFLLVIDQFEELFSLGEGSAVSSFLRALTTIISDPHGRVTILLALRADFYDRPLLHPDFSSVFTRGVVNAVPMSTDERRAAVVGPAHEVGVDVEPALLGQLLADTADQPGALPLLQYTLTELFDLNRDAVLTLDAYRTVGGVNGALSRRANELFTMLAEDRRQVAVQVFLRLVRPTDGAPSSRRRVPLSQLTTLALDPVALSEVLEAFGGQRLLTFDHDPVNGSATVEVAHDALLSAWDRLARWVERHRADLRHLDALATAADEWQSSGRNPDYLLIGSRLAEYEAWSAATDLQLNAPEREFLGAGVARRDTEQAEETARRDRQRQLERRARTRLWGLLGTIALLGAAAAFGLLTWLGSGPSDVALLFEGTGDAGFGDMAAKGFDDAVAELGLDADTHVVVTGGTREVEAELRRLSDEGVDLVVVGIGAFGAADTAAVAADHPETWYVTWENGLDLPNVTDISFRSEEASFLAGAAAAHASQTGTIGFIGAFPYPIIDAYRAGFEAGARWVDPGTRVLFSYLSELPDPSGIDSRELGERAAAGLYADGADVVLAVGSSLGAVQAAHAASDAHGRQLWVIGVDTDVYLSVLTAPLPDEIAPADWQEHVLTSVTKELDTAFHTVLASYARGSLAPGARSFGLTEGAVDILYSGGFLDDIRPQLEDARRQIISGEIRVPSVPEY